TSSTLMPRSASLSAIASESSLLPVPVAPTTASRGGDASPASAAALAVIEIVDGGCCDPKGGQAERHLAVAGAGRCRVRVGGNATGCGFDSIPRVAGCRAPHAELLGGDG